MNATRKGIILSVDIDKAFDSVGRKNALIRLINILGP